MKKLIAVALITLCSAPAFSQKKPHRERHARTTSSAELPPPPKPGEFPRPPRPGERPPLPPHSGSLPPGAPPPPPTPGEVFRSVFKKKSKTADQPAQNTERKIKN